MRSVRSELLSVAEVLALPLMVAAAFPFGAIGFSASRDAQDAGGSTASIVFLDEVSVARVMRAARTMSRSEDHSRAYVDLLPAELPPAGNGPAMAIGPRRSPAALPVVEGGIPPFLPSRRAAAPARIPVEATKDAPAFSRDELLKLN